MTKHTQLVGTLAVFAVLSVSTLSACNTIEGAGKDIKSTGKAIEDAADD
jgi:predicted small secreted protein